ncbi:peptidoglycan DD-metalloendopeptidase family protein [Streptomyces sp. INA 01156]
MPTPMPLVRRTTGTPDTAGTGSGAGRRPRAGVPAVGRVWPVGVRPRVLRGWEPPETRYGRGHRGVDLAAAPGTPVRAVAAGRVSYAGRVAGRASSRWSCPARAPASAYDLRAGPAVGGGGAEVAPGEVIGTVAATGSHCTAPCTGAC